MSNRITVRNSAASLLFGFVFLGFSVFEFVYGFSANDKNEQNTDYTFGILGAVIGVAVLLMYFMIKYEYDEKGFIYTNVLGKAREISYGEIFSLMYTNKNTLRVELEDGTAISISTNGKKAKEFARVIETAYAQKSQAVAAIPRQQ